MRIVMIGPFGLRARGTMSVRALPMARALVARGHTATLLLPPWHNPKDGGQCWEEDGVAIENIHLPPNIPGLSHLIIALRLAWRAMALRPDVIHLFKPKAHSGLAHWLLSRLPRAHRPRLVVDADDWEGPGGWNEIGGYTPAQRRFFAWQERWGLTHADAVTVASRALEGLVWALGVPPERVFYAPNGVGQKAGGKRQKARSKHPASCILLYTRFFEFPVSRVIEVLWRVREQIPEARLLVVGKGFSGEEEILLKLAQETGLASAVEYVGFVEPEKLSSYFAQADVAIYPFDDTLLNRAKCPVKLLELLAAGVPVVAEAVGQNREYIRHTETGWLVPSGDVDSFAEAVTQLLEGAQLRERLGQAAARDARERFAWERLIEAVERDYKMGQ
ncbi:MAG: glycosyltransferase family 1 protein [Chloroflexi bacterium]|nr:MAG: glycosyltransferase family 1 protein [Chloroflexota bacterium]RLC88090.1 MAG: glycosyltransferase family 1 protein [Chloroflexota bacterium]